MAVIRWDEISRSGGVDAQNYRTYTRNFRLYTDSPDDGPLEVSSAIPIAIWSSYYSISGESDPYALAKTISVQPHASEPNCWDYVVTYDTRPFDYGTIANPLTGSSPPGLGAAPTTPSAPTPPGQTDPAVRPWSIKFGSDNTTFAPVEDLTGAPIAASNGQRYTGLTIDYAVPYFALSIPLATVNTAKHATYINTVNNDLFMGYLPGTLRCTQYDITSQFEQQWGYFWQVDLKFQINPDGWDVRIIDEGNFWREGDGSVSKLTDKWSNPVDSPVWLNGAGGKNLTAFPVYRTFQVYRLRPFTSIL